MGHESACLCECANHALYPVRHDSVAITQGIALPTFFASWLGSQWQAVQYDRLGADPPPSQLPTPDVSPREQKQEPYEYHRVYEIGELLNRLELPEAVEEYMGRRRGKFWEEAEDEDDEDYLDDFYTGDEDIQLYE